MKRPLISTPNLIVAALLAAGTMALAGAAGRPQQEEVREVVANLAAGRVYIYVASDGVAIAALGNPVEPGARAPAIVPLGGGGVGILLGAVEWVYPTEGGEIADLAAELPRMARSTGPQQPRLRLQEQPGALEQTGLALLEPLRAAAESLHAEIDLPKDEPVVELVMVQNQGPNGPEVWNLRYRLLQEAMRGEYLQTRVLRPDYIQLYPPDKHQPHTLIELHYPLDDSQATLLDLLSKGDPRLERISAAGPELAAATDRLSHGETQKAHVADAAAFLRAAIANLGKEDEVQAVGVLDQRGAFDWLLAPPTPVRKAAGAAARPLGAPTLQKNPR